MTNTENATPAPVDSYPYKIGRVVYPTLAAAETAKANAREIYPDAPLPIIDRLTGEVVG